MSKVTKQRGGVPSLTEIEKEYMNHLQTGNLDCIIAYATNITNLQILKNALNNQYVFECDIAKKIITMRINYLSTK